MTKQIECMRDSDLRIQYGSDGKVSAITDDLGTSSGIVTAITDPVTGGISYSQIATPNNGSLINFSTLNYPKTRKALANLAIGTRFNVLCLGDSTTVGQRNGYLAGDLAASWVSRLSTKLISLGINAGWQNIMGSHELTLGNLVIMDSRLTTPPVSYTQGSLESGVGGKMFYQTASPANTDALTFTPKNQAGTGVTTDTLDVYYLDTGAPTAFTIKGGATGTTACSAGGTVVGSAGDNKLKVATATCAGTSVWTIQKTTSDTNSQFIQGFAASLSTSPEVSLLNCGRSSMSVANLIAIGNPFSAFTEITGSGQALTGTTLAIINIGINDMYSVADATAYQASLTTLVSGLQAVGTEVVLVIPNPVNVSAAALSAYRSAILTVAIAKNCAVVDVQTRWGNTVANSNTYGYLGDTITHPSSSGYADIANAVFQFWASL